MYYIHYIHYFHYFQHAEFFYIPPDVYHLLCTPLRAQEQISMRKTEQNVLNQTPERPAKPITLPAAPLIALPAIGGRHGPQKKQPD